MAAVREPRVPAAPGGGPLEGAEGAARPRAAGGAEGGPWEGTQGGRGRSRSGPRHPLVVGLGMAILASAAFLATLPDYGPVSDEGNYLESSRRLFGWAEHLARSLKAGSPGQAFTDPVLAESWRWGGDRIPHPPFSREVAGLSGYLFFGRMEMLTAYRLLGALLAGVLAGTVAAWGAVRSGTIGGVFAGAAFVLMPRVFAHAHFATTDFLLAGLFFWTLFYAAEARRAPLAWAGALWGLALATKFSAVLLPLALFPWLLAFRRDRLRELPLFLVAAAATFAAVNPALWADPAAALGEYLRQGFGRREISMAQLPTFYLGRMYVFHPPWHYPLVMLLLTLPLGTLLLAVCGAVVGPGRLLQRPAACLSLLVAAVFLGALALPSAPVHDDVRLFLPVFPFLALLSGFGAAWLARLRPASVLGPALVCIVLVEPALATVRLHPHQASYFNALAGGVSGAEKRGLEVTGMKEVLNRDVYADLNRLLPRGAALDGGSFLYEELLFAQGAGWLRPDVVVRRQPPAGYVLVVNRRGWFRATDRALVHFSRPAYALRLDGVPLVALYRLR
jgi:hypothetical protein